jgi:hypothetical protein
MGLKMVNELNLTAMQYLIAPLALLLLMVNLFHFKSYQLGIRTQDQHETLQLGGYPMAKTPFTQELLHQILEETGTMSLDLIQDKLPDWSEKDIKSRLSGWRYRNAIDYKMVDGEIEDFELLHNKKNTTEAITAGKLLKLEEYFKQVQATAEIINKPTASDSNRLKAIQLQQVAIEEIPDFFYKELTEIYN